MGFLLGIDMGTTNIKVNIFDIQGNGVAAARLPSPVTIQGDGGGVYDARMLWNTACSALCNALNDLDARYGAGARKEIKGLAITSVGEAGLPLDRDGNELYPVIAWYDNRSMAYADWWKKGLGEDEILEITGLRIQYIFTVNKIMWLRDHEPEIYRRMAKWACVADYIAFKLTGELAMDCSLASRTMMLDAKKCIWSDRIMQAAGLEPGILPPVVQSGSPVGEVTAGAAKKTGLCVGTSVFAGGHDHICGAFAAGVMSRGMILDSSGTAEETLTSVDNFDDLHRSSVMGFNVGRHVVAGKYYMAGGIPASGSSADWFRREFGFSDADEPKCTPGAGGLLFLPHLRGSSSPLRNTVSKGAFIGIRPYHTKYDFFQAVYEGLCFEFRQSIELLLQGARPERVVVIGGGTRDPLWMQTKADVLGMSIEIPKNRESTAMGAALLAGTGSGAYADAKEAVAATYQLGRMVEPRREYTEYYEQKYEVFKNLYMAVLEVNTSLENLKVK
jgi:xylulokinase